jgi:phosphoserine / homoserine phosphotransferase
MNMRIMPQRIICLDLEGVLIPEIWIAVAEATGIPELRRTTRDVPDYDELMRGRLHVLAQHGVTLTRLRSIAAQMEPLSGARAFLDALRRSHQVCILSDTFTQFAVPVMEHLGYPLILCNELVAGGHGAVTNYRLRQPNGKRAAVAAFKTLNLEVVAVGDSFNDITMLREAHRGLLFRPSEPVTAAHPDLTVTTTYEELEAILLPPAGTGPC